MKKTLQIGFLAVILAVSAFGQLTTTSTTLSAAVAANNSGGAFNQVCVASATGINLPSISQPGSYLWIVDAGGGGEGLQVTALGTSSTCFLVKRGQFGSSANAAHASGATVYVGNAATGSGDSSRPFTGVFTTTRPNGSCVATAQFSLPIIVTGGLKGTGEGLVVDCVNQQWTNKTSTLTQTISGGTQASGTSPSAAPAVSTITGGTGGAQSATTGNGAAGGAIVGTGGVGGAGGTSSGTGGAGGGLTYTGGLGGGTVTGGVGGAVNSVGGAGAVGSTTGGAGGASNVTGGAGGVGPTAGVGGATLVTGGAGGAQSATTSGGSAGGSSTITAGVGGAGGSVSGTGGTGGAGNLIGGAGGGTITGGTGGLTSVGGGAGGNGSTAGGTGGGFNAYSGAAGSGGTGTSGAVNIRSGGASGTPVFNTTTAGATSVNSAGTAQKLLLYGSTSGKVGIADGTDTTKQVVFDPSGATASTAVTLAAAQAANVTVGLPIQTGALPTAYFCGATSGSTTCANTATGGTARVFGGIATLSSNSAVISGISPAFTSTSTYTCVANDLTTRANPVQIANTSSSSITITNTTGASDVINYICVGY